MDRASRLPPGTALGAAVAAAVSVVACGARSELDGGGGGIGGASVGEPSASRAAVTATAAATTGGASTGIVDPECTGFVLDGPPIDLPPGARAPQLAVEGATMRVAWHEGRFVYSQRLDPENRWPEPFAQVEQHVHIGDDGRFVLAPTSPTPAFLHTDSSVAVLQIVGAGMEPVPAASPGLEPLFLVRNGDRWLYASASSFAGGFYAGVGSYEAGGLPQSQDPSLCLATPERVVAVPAGEGFVAAFADAPDPLTSCSVAVPPAATGLSIARYDPPAGPALGFTLLASTPLTEPILQLGLTPTSAGSWLVLQTDGRSSRVPPPVTAVQIGPNAAPIGAAIAVSDETLSSDLGVTTLGEALVVARVPLIKAPPRIEVRRLEVDGTLHPNVIIETGSPLVKGSLHVAPTSSARSLLVTWQRTNGPSQIAKLDCLP